jgi:hypothetical protein
MDVRDGESEPCPTTNLVFHHCVTNILDETIQHIRVLDVVEETLDLALFFQPPEFSDKGPQFSSQPHPSDSVLNL